MSARRIGMLAAIAVLGSAPGSAAAVAVLRPPDATLERTFLVEDAPGPGEDGWDPREFRRKMEERLLSFLPDGVIQDVARTFADQTLQIDLSPTRAFVRLRLPL